jgi:hypothetical protein
VTRSLTSAETEVLRVFSAACEQLAVTGPDLDRLMGGIEEQLHLRDPAPEERDAVADVPEKAWSEIGAAAALGVLSASGAPHLKRRDLRHPAVAGFEPLEVAMLSNRALGGLLLRRWARAIRGRRNGG